MIQLPESSSLCLILPRFALNDIVPGTGVCALVNNKQVAVSICR